MEESKACSLTSVMEQQVFKSLQDLMDWVHNLGRSLGYVIVKRRSKTRPSGLLSRVTLVCDRSGIYKSNKISSRNTRTKKINCPFELVGKYSKMNGFWTIRVICEKHNHEPSLDMKGHPYAMRLSDSETRLVADLSMNNVKPRDILSTLKEKNLKNVSTLKTIYNARQKLKNKHSQKNHTDVLTQDSQRRSCSSSSTFQGLDVLKSHKPAECSSYFGQICYSHPHINQFPNVFHPYITQIQDVEDDGNCGFRAIAASLGRHEDEWSVIRSELLDELDTHKMEYDKIFGSENRLLLHKRLNFFHSPAPFEHQMIVPEMGTVIASRYNVILHCLSSGSSMTYLPFLSNPVKAYQHIAIAIGIINGNRYVKVTLRAGYPMPPVVPQWFRFRHPCASAWIIPYTDQINMYNQCFCPNPNFEGV